LEAGWKKLQSGARGPVVLFGRLGNHYVSDVGRDRIPEPVEMSNDARFVLESKLLKRFAFRNRASTVAEFRSVTLVMVYAFQDRRLDSWHVTCTNVASFVVRRPLLESIQTIQNLVAPVILISAIGLFCLGLYNRLAMVVQRMRTTHREHFDGVTSLLREPRPDNCNGRRLTRRVELLQSQSALLIRRARVLRNSLVTLLAAVLSLLLCSLTLGFLSDFTWLPIGFLTTAILTMILGICFAIFELYISLEPVSTEGASVLHDELDPETISAKV
jgi:hypothetical protein